MIRRNHGGVDRALLSFDLNIGTNLSIDYVRLLYVYLLAYIDDGLFLN